MGLFPLQNFLIFVQMLLTSIIICANIITETKVKAHKKWRKTIMMSNKQLFESKAKVVFDRTGVLCEYTHDTVSKVNHLIIQNPYKPDGAGFAFQVRGYVEAIEIIEIVDAYYTVFKDVLFTRVEKQMAQISKDEDRIVYVDTDSIKKEEE